MVQVGAAVVGLSQHTITIERRSGAYVAGVWNEGAPVLTEGVAASVSPVLGRDLMRLPEGQRHGELVQAFVLPSIDVRPGDVESGQTPDVLIVGSRRYQVQRVDDWAAYGYLQVIARAEEI